ncbi:nucleoside hydrolase [Pseudomonas sp. RIT-PI-S]|uniref:nucleoside hydrolase n=1 Tax=Pseudomonas sp. RIT-PI-S TaxID=3035295 RepID=UPI0021D8AFFC|nr:nucleoside hydrolase [Pseudomonas sp. RIT-PI-S]
MLNLIIDTDPGVDDMVALLLAMAHPEALNLMAITTVAGNVTLEKTTRNACLIREWARRGDVPVYAGADRPLQRAPLYAEHVHGSEGLPEFAVHPPAEGAAAEPAVDYLVRTLGGAAPASITLAMLGPQTNLALALRRAPEIARALRQVVIMGGAWFNAGNVTPTAEFNLFADPHAAAEVLASDVPLVYIPLDVTHKVLTSHQRLEHIGALGTRASERVAAVVAPYIQHDIERYGLPGGPVHDANVIGWLLDPGLYEGIAASVEVTCEEGEDFGRSVLREEAMGAGSVTWLTGADSEGFFSLLEAALSRLP